MEWKELYALAMSAKTKAHLKNGRKRVKVHISTEQKTYIQKEQLDEILNADMSKELAKSLLNEVRNYKTVEPHEMGGEIHELDVMIFPTEMIWHVINEIIRELSLEQIAKIKG
jgi:ASC-1-like (ASCH) protein